jgi:hypothetical protein
MISDIAQPFAIESVPFPAELADWRAAQQEMKRENSASAFRRFGIRPA